MATDLPVESTMTYTDDGPSNEDIERFDSETGWCPECGAEVWDDATICQSCGDDISGKVLAWPRDQYLIHKRAMMVVLVVVLIAFLLWFL